MDEKIVQEILREVFASLEAVETKSSAILQFMKHKGIAKPEELEPYMEQAGNASSVRWLAARVRIEHLIAGAMKSAEQEAKKEAPQDKDKGTGKEADDSAKAKALATKPGAVEAGEAKRSNDQSSEGTSAKDKDDKSNEDKTEKSGVQDGAKANPSEPGSDKTPEADQKKNNTNKEGAEKAA